MLDADLSSSTDPFIILHNDLHGLIYQHFRCKDVCKLFKVSKQWNSRISESAKAMQNILLNFHDYSMVPSPKSVTALLQSERMYQNIKFSLRTVSNSYQKHLILERFSQSVSFLDISVVTRADSKRFFPTNLSFPMLKELRFRGEIPTSLFKNLKTLEKCCICFKSFDDESDDAIERLTQLDIFDLIKDNNNLKDSDNIFQKRSLFDVKFKLNSFSMFFGFLFPQSPQNFHDFLLFHSDTLTSLKLDFLDSEDSEDAVTILTKLPVLKELQVDQIIEFSKGASNKTISSLKCASLSHARQILESLKGIESIEVDYYSLNDFRWVIKNVMQLKKIEFKLLRG